MSKIVEKRETGRWCGCQKILFAKKWYAHLVAENICKQKIGIQHPTDLCCAGSSLPGGLNQLFHHAEVMLFDLGFCSNCIVVGISCFQKTGKETVVFFSHGFECKRFSKLHWRKQKQPANPLYPCRTGFPPGYCYRSEKKSFPWLSSRCLQVFGCCKML